MQHTSGRRRFATIGGRADASTAADPSTRCTTRSQNSWLPPEHAGDLGETVANPTGLPIPGGSVGRLSRSLHRCGKPPVCPFVPATGGHRRYIALLRKSALRRRIYPGSRVCVGFPATWTTHSRYHEGFSATAAPSGGVPEPASRSLERQARVASFEVLGFGSAERARAAPRHFALRIQNL